MNSSTKLRFARETLTGSVLMFLGLNCCSPSGGHPLVEIEGNAAAGGKSGGTGGKSGATGSGGSANAAGSGGAGNTSGAGDTGGQGNAGNTGGQGNTGNVSSGGVGNTGIGGQGNTGNTGGQGNTGNTAGQGNTGNSGNTGGQGNTGNTGGQGNTGNTGGSGGGNTGGGGNVDHPPPITNGQNAWASRYWDCCKPACGWTGNTGGRQPMSSCNQQNQSLGGDYGARNACEPNNPGPAHMCWSGHPWSVSDRLAYGFAAASGGNYVCGRCFQLQFTGSGHHGNNPGAQALNGKTMIVQVINNGGVADDQFDILIPGGGVGALNACDTQWPNHDLGAQYGGFLTACNGDANCVRNRCQTVFGDKPELMAGCDWFLGWYAAADNPNVVYQRIPCPAAITQRSGLSDPG